MRTAKLVDYLPEWGWRPTVVSRDDGVGAKGVDGIVRVAGPFPEHASYQLAAWLWAVRVRDTLRRVLGSGDFDLVYVTCPPFPPGLAAGRVAAEAGVPLVVDFRDAWALDPLEGGSAPKRLAKRALRRWVYPRLERRLLESARGFVVNTPSMRAAYAAREMPPGLRVAYVPNGFDEADFVGPAPALSPRGSIPELLYCGRFAGVAGRSPAPLFEALRLLDDAGMPVHVRVLGDDTPTTRDAVAAAGVPHLVRQEATVPHDDAIRAIRSAHALVLVQAPGVGLVTPISGKTYEYIRSGRPLLAIVPPGDNAEVVRRHAPDAEIVESDRPDAIAAGVRAVLARLPAETVERDRDFLVFDRRRLSRKLAALFDEVVDDARQG